MADNNLAAQTHAGADMAELAVAVSALVEVHEVHVDFIPGYLGIELGVEMQQRLGELLQAMNPHFSRRECVHPGDYTHTFLAVVGSFHQLGHFARRVGGAFIYDFYREIAGIVEAIHHLFRVGINLYNGVTAIEKLGAGDPPHLIVFKCIHR